jgi:hypothetical protein
LGEAFPKNRYFSDDENVAFPTRPSIFFKETCPVSLAVYFLKVKPGGLLYTYIQHHHQEDGSRIFTTATVHDGAADEIVGEQCNTTGQGEGQDSVRVRTKYRKEQEGSRS